MLHFKFLNLISFINYQIFKFLNLNLNQHLINYYNNCKLLLMLNHFNHCINLLAIIHFIILMHYGFIFNQHLNKNHLQHYNHLSYRIVFNLVNMLIMFMGKYMYYNSCCMLCLFVKISFS